MLKNKVISIILISLLILTCFNITVSHDNIASQESPGNSLEDEVIDVKTISNDIPNRGSRGSGNSKLCENNAYGGSWVDSFEDDSGIEYIYNIFHQICDLTLRKFRYIPNGDFEEGNLGQVPDNWTYHVYRTGSFKGSHITTVKQVNTHYFSGSKAVYGYVKSQATSGAYRTHINFTPTPGYQNLSGAKYVYVSMRDIKTYHSVSSWGWNLFVFI